jgi:Ca2+:H+ antiporter
MRSVNRMSPRHVAIFIGIMFLTIIGGAAESESAIAAALKDKMNLLVSIAFGVSI